MRRLAVLCSIAVLATAAPAAAAPSDQASALPDPAAVRAVAADVKRDLLNAAVKASPGAAQERPDGALKAQGCYGSYHRDGSDGTRLDAASYGLLYGCVTPGGWAFDVSTYDAVSAANVGRIDVYADTDGNPATGCVGFEWNVFGTHLSSTGELAAGVFYLPSCEADPIYIDAAELYQLSSNRLAMLFENSSWGAPAAFDWVGAVVASSDAAAEWLPKDGFHHEADYLNGCATTAQGRYFTVSDEDSDAARVAAVLGAAGAADVDAAGRVVRFTGDAPTLQRALDARAPGTVLRPDVLRQPSELTNDPERTTQWNLDAIGATGAWDVTHGSSSLSVAVLDSGFDGNHPDLRGKLVAGYDAATGSTLGTGNTDDASGHGTATAGVVAAATGNGIGLSGVGYDTTVLPIKVADADGSLPTSLMIRGLYHAADRGARVINISLGACEPVQEEAEAVRYAQARGALVIAAAGNQRLEGNPVSYPAAYERVLAVGATGVDGRHADYSNTGTYLDLAAPGGSGDGNPAHDVPVLAAGGGTRRVAGTSFAAPTVAAAAALVLAVDPTLTADQVARVLGSTSRDAGPAGWDEAYGAGSLDLHAAVLAASPTAPSPAPASPSPSPSASANPAPTPEAVSSPSASPSPTATSAATPSPSAAPVLQAQGLFRPLPPSRVLDTRDGTGGLSGRLSPQRAASFVVAGRGGVPTSGVSAVALNVTVTAPTASGHLTVYPAGRSVPDASSLNYVSGQSVPNLVVVPVAPDGGVGLFSSAGSPHVIADVVGYYRSGGEVSSADSSFVALAPARVLDSRRSDSDITGRLPAGRPVTVHLAGRGGVPTSGVSAVVLNTTVTGATAAGFLTVFPGGQASVPNASNLNYRAGQTVPNLVVVPVAQDGSVQLFSNAGSPYAIADVVGYYTAQPSRGRLTPLAPQRVLDTRSGAGGIFGRLPAGTPVTLTVAGRGGVPAAGAQAVILNVTVTGPLASGHLTVFPGGRAAPVASNLNYVRSQTVPNLVVVPLGADGTVQLLSNAGGPNVLADVVGWIG